MYITIESEPTTNSVDFDPMFRDVNSFFCFGTSSVVTRN